MNTDDALLMEISHILIRARDNSVDAEDFSRLQHLLKTRAQAREYYFDMVSSFVVLEEMQDLLANEEDEKVMELLTALAENEKTAAAVTIESEAEEASAAGCAVSPVPKKRNKLSLALLILSSAALFFILFVLHFLSPVERVQVATVTDSIGARWTGLSPVPETGTRLETNAEPMLLAEGIVKIHCDSGIQMVVEGPCQFSFITAMEVHLQYGRLFATVSNTGRGFTVTTEQARIIDLGTEFGVQTLPDGSTELHVYKGKTALVAGSREDQKRVIDVLAGMARRIDSIRSEVQEIGLKKELFVQHIASEYNLVWRGQPLSLACVVSGGDGFSGGDVKTGIDPATGLVGGRVVQAFNRLGHEGYHPVHPRRFIDGVFIPDGGPGGVPVSSAGHRFDDFPDTDSYYWADITADPYILDVSEPDEERRQEGRLLPLGLDAPDLPGIQEAPLLLLHPNVGITFDLEAIRQALGPLAEIRSFQAVCGVSSNVPRFQHSEFWVLVDGRSVFHAADGAELPKMIEIPLRPDQRFLTLAATDGGDQIINDWCLFVNPELVIGSAL